MTHLRQPHVQPRKIGVHLELRYAEIVWNDVNVEFHLSQEAGTCKGEGRVGRGRVSRAVQDSGVVKEKSKST